MNIRGKCVLAGFVVGVIYAVWYLVYNIYIQFPGMPGMGELIIQILILAEYGAIGAALGLVVGLVVNLLLTKARRRG